MPSYTTLADAGLKAFNASNYPEAIKYYTEALELNPEAPDYYLKRSIAFQRSSDYERALYDAELAVMLAHKRGRRELIGSGQLRRGIALYLLGRVGDAGLCFTAAEKRCNEKEKNMLGMWKKKLEMALGNIHEDDVNREVTILEIPNVEVPAVKEARKESEPTDEGPKTSGDDDGSKTPVANSLAPTPPPVMTPAGKIRHEWYQTSTHVVVSLIVKGVPQDKTVIEINEKSLSISFPMPTGTDFVFDIDPFYDNVIGSESTSKILSTKVEVKLHKANPGKKWASLEGLQSTEVDNQCAATTKPEPVTKDKPLYPSSSKTGPKDWDLLAKQLTSKPKKNGKAKQEEGESNVNDDDSKEMEEDSDYEGGDPVNHFFKKLYKDADEDTRRAMMKSYIESNGTALSTNWEEVGKGKVETSPPDGMTAKKWNQ